MHICEIGAVLLAFLWHSAPPVRATFFPGRIMYANNEYPELGGRMRPRLAAIRCESDPECAGFTFMGAPGQSDPAHVAFFRFVGEVSVTHHDLDWTFYTVDRDAATYAGQLPEQGAFVELEAADDEHMAPGRQLVQFLLENNGSAAAVSHDGRVRLYSQVDLGTMRKAEGWMTYLNLHLTRDFAVVGLNKRLSLELCCPSVILTSGRLKLTKPFDITWLSHVV